MPPIDSIGSYPASAAQYQPRPQTRNTSQSDEGGLSVQQYLQNAQQSAQVQVIPSLSDATQTQTVSAVAPAGNSRESEPTNRPAANDSGGTVQTLSQFLGRFSNVGNDRQQPGNQPVTTQPETSQNSALNYTANGAANPAQSPTDAGRRVSLSV